MTALTDAFVLGMTVQVNSNRMQEAAGFPVLISGLTAGWANVSAQNLTSYCLITHALPNYLVDAQNIALNTAFCPRRKMAAKSAPAQNPSQG